MTDVNDTTAPPPTEPADAVDDVAGEATSRTAQAAPEQASEATIASVDGLPTGETSEKLVPVNEAIRYRKRAQQAERQADDMQQQMQSLQSKLDEAEQTIQHLERRQKIDATLAEAEPIDTEAVRLLTEQAIQQMDEPDVQTAVEELRHGRPYLFRQHTTGGTSSMAARFNDETGRESEHAAEQAAMSGDRRDLLRYLRLRRGR
jgi:alanyl-tRNA synthetase